MAFFMPPSPRLFIFIISSCNLLFKTEYFLRGPSFIKFKNILSRYTVVISYYGQGSGSGFGARGQRQRENERQEDADNNDHPLGWGPMYSEDGNRQIIQTAEEFTAVVRERDAQEQEQGPPDQQQQTSTNLDADVPSDGPEQGEGCPLGGKQQRIDDSNQCVGKRDFAKRDLCDDCKNVGPQWLRELEPLLVVRGEKPYAGHDAVKKIQKH